jgi:hemin uptake protein HemP
MDAHRYRKPDEASARATQSIGQSPIPRIDSERLLDPRGQLIIVHGSREYRLRKTSRGKLILTA